MATETLGRSEALVATFPRACVIANAGMAVSLVATQMIVSLEGLAAVRLVANKWTFTGVRANVFFKTAWTAESPAATVVIANIGRWARIGGSGLEVCLQRLGFFYCVLVSFVGNDEHRHTYCSVDASTKRSRVGQALLPRVIALVSSIPWPEAWPLRNLNRRRCCVKIFSSGCGIERNLGRN